MGIHYDGDMEEAKTFFDNFPVEWINGHREYNEIRRVKKIADLLGIRNIALPNAYSDVSSHNLVKDFLSRKGEDGFYTFHLDYFLFWHLSRVIR